MTPRSIARLALAGLALTAASALQAQDEAARVPGNKYAVVNQTGGELACRYRVNSAMGGGAAGAATWQATDPIAAGAEFSRTVQGPGESVSLDCDPEGARGDPFTVQPGKRYRVTKGDDGRIAVTRVRT